MRRTLFVLLGFALLGIILACSLTSPSAPAPDGDLVATQVALALTQTAIAAPAATSAPPTAVPSTPLPATTQPATPTSTASPPTATATSRAVSPPYDGPCTPALTASAVTPQPNVPTSFIGYRYSGKLGDLFPEYYQRPYFGFLLSAADLGLDAPGFAISGYERPDLGIITLFFERMVCRQADGRPYWEVVDALAFPRPATAGDFGLITANHITFAPGTFAHTTLNLGLGWSATLECSPPLYTQPVASLYLDPATLPTTIANGTRVPVTMRAGWAVNAATQRLEALDPAMFSCVLVFHG